MSINNRALLPRHTETIKALVNGMCQENGQVLVRPPGMFLRTLQHACNTTILQGLAKQEQPLRLF